MFNAREAELRLALLGLFSVAADVPGLQPDVCAAALDLGTAAVSTASRETMEMIGADEPVRVRFGAARLLNALCASCRACPRGMDAERLTEAAPG